MRKSIGEEAASLARGWLGTPYRHQASLPGAGTDCLGLVRGIWRQLYGSEPEVVPAYTSDWSEPQHDERLWRAALRHLCHFAEEEIQVGQVILFRMREGCVAKHLGVVTACGQEATFIHAYNGHGVIESPFSTPWQRRVVARFMFPERRL